MLTSSCMYVCPFTSPHWSSSVPTGRIFAKFCLYHGRLLKSVEKIQDVKKGGDGGGEGDRYVT